MGLCGTPANPRDWTGKQGGEVVRAFVLTGHFYIDKLHFSQEQLFELLQRRALTIAKDVRKEGLSPPEAVRCFFRTIGHALCATTAVFAPGLMAFAAPGSTNHRALGLLLGITIVIALITDLLLPPTLLMAIDRRKK